MATVREWLSRPELKFVPRVRPSQVQMAEACEEIMRDGGIALIEAPTGTGKSLGYSLPALLSGKRTVISTGKKALQQQLIGQDLPHMVQTVQAVPIAILKGKTNYVCRLRWEEFQGNAGSFLSATDERAFEEWLEEDLTGDLSDWGHMPWLGQVRVGECVAKHCEHAENCGYVFTKLRARAAQLLVVNHAMLGYDLARGGGKMFGQYDVLVIDEAHAAPNFFRDAVSLHLTPRQPELLGRALKDTPYAPPEAFGDAFKVLFSSLPNREAKLELSKPIQGALARILAFGQTLAGSLGDPEEAEVGSDAHGKAKLAAAARTVADIVAACQMVLGENKDPRRDPDNHIAYIERSARDEHLITVSPLEVGPFIAPSLLGLHAVIITSATLSTTGGSMGFIRREYGLNADQVTKELVLPSPFDYSRTALFVSPTAPDPSKRGQDYYDAMADEVHALLEASSGGAFVLCASREDMDKLHDMLYRRYHPLPYRLGKQTSATTETLLDWFRQDPTSVLIALKTFWEGVDEKNLRLVVIPRMPFPVPSDLVLTARKKKYVERKMEQDECELRKAELAAWDAFDFQLAVLDVKQGAGRLMRHEQGKGIVAILDKRCYGRVKAYAAKVRNALPHPYTDDKAEVLEVLRAFGQEATKR